MSIFSNKPNIEDLKKKLDIESLGKLLKNSNTNIRKESSLALLELLIGLNCRGYFLDTKAFGFRGQKAVEDNSLAVKIINQFIDSNIKRDDDIFDGLIQFLNNLKEEEYNIKVESRGNADAITAVCSVVLVCGGLDQIIEIQKELASKMTRYAGDEGGYYITHNFLRFHSAISISLIGYSAFEKLDLEKLVHIIPYSVCEWFDACQKLIEHIKDSEPIMISNESFTEIKKAFENLPDNVYGGVNYAVTRLRSNLMDKLKIQN